MKVSTLMHRNPITCRTHDTLERAAQLMWEHDVGCLPIVDDDGKVAGMITDRDICMAAYTSGQPLRTVPVTTAMAAVVYSCTADDSLREVERTMQAHQIRRMPVIDEGGHPIALLSLGDIARSAGHNSVSASDVATTLAAVTAPRALLIAPM